MDSCHSSHKLLQATSSQKSNKLKVATLCISGLLFLQEPNHLDFLNVISIHSHSLVFILPPMSQNHEKSPQHCAKKSLSIDKRYKKLLYAFFTILFSILSVIFIVYYILHPSKPEFSLKEVDIYQLNLFTGPQLVNSSIQFTLLSNNPNQKVGIYYDELLVSASYKRQQITNSTSLPPFYQGHDESNLLTASLIGNGVPVTQSFGYEVLRDTTVGKIVLNLKVNGWLRWKVCSWVTGKYKFHVNCVAIMPLGPSIPSAPLSSRQGTQCSTTL